MNHNIFGFETQRHLGSLSYHGINHGLSKIHLGHGISEFVWLGLLKFNRAFAHDVTFVPTCSRFFELPEEFYEQLILKDSKGLGRQLKLLTIKFDALLFGNFTSIVFDRALHFL